MTSCSQSSGTPTESRSSLAQRAEWLQRLQRSASPSADGSDGVAQIEPRHLPWRHSRNFLDPLANFDDLYGAGLGMRLDASPRCPFVGVVVMIDVRRRKGDLSRCRWTIKRMSRLTRS